MGGAEGAGGRRQEARDKRQDAKGKRQKARGEMQEKRDKGQKARKGDRSGFMGIFFLVGIIPFNGRVDYGMLESSHA